MADSSKSRFEAMVSRAENELNLAEAALLIAVDEYPQLQVLNYLLQLDQIAEAVRKRLPKGVSHLQAIRILNQYLFDEQGFAGNMENYSDPRNSYLNEVLDRKVGIPITLSVVYMEVGWRLGIPLEGVSFPGHFLVKCSHKDGDVVLDPFFKGVSLSEKALEDRIRHLLGGDVPAREFLPHLLTAATKKETLVRMLRNLKAIYLKQDEQLRALSCIDRILAVVPNNAQELRDRGDLYDRLECPRAAVADFTRYLELAPDAEDATDVRKRLVELQASALRLN